MISEIEIEDAGKSYGMDIKKLPIKQQRILTVMYQYNHGWIGEDVLEIKMSKVIRARK